MIDGGKRGVGFYRCWILGKSYVEDFDRADVFLIRGMYRVFGKDGASRTWT